MSKLVRRFRARRRAKRNPAEGPIASSSRLLLEDIAAFALPGFGGFAATRFVTRVAATQISKKWPQYAKHAGAAGSVGSFLAAFFLAHKWDWLKKYQMPVVVGSAIAALQSLIQIYAPNKLGWMVSDANADLKASVLARQIQQSQANAQLPDHLEEINDDPAWYTYNDAYDAGRYSAGGGNKQQPSAMPASNAPTEDDIIDDLQDGDDALAAGIFAPGN